MTVLRILPPAAKYFKKLKDTKLKKIFQDAVDAILENPLLAVIIQKTGSKFLRSLSTF